MFFPMFSTPSLLGGNLGELLPTGHGNDKCCLWMEAKRNRVGFAVHRFLLADHTMFKGFLLQKVQPQHVRASIRLGPHVVGHS
jgi:hypothetical protein